jgi:hypothetical protein
MRIPAFGMSGLSRLARRVQPPWWLEVSSKCRRELDSRLSGTGAHAPLPGLSMSYTSPDPESPSRSSGTAAPPPRTRGPRVAAPAERARTGGT